MAFKEDKYEDNVAGKYYCDTATVNDFTSDKSNACLIAVDLGGEFLRRMSVPAPDEPLPRNRFYKEENQKINNTFLKYYAEWIRSKILNIKKALILCGERGIPIINANYTMLYKDGRVPWQNTSRKSRPTFFLDDRDHQGKRRARDFEKCYLNWSLFNGEKLRVEEIEKKIGCKFKYNNKNNVFDPQKYQTVYFLGGSLDACLLDARYFSFNNIKHNNKKLIVDCVIQNLKKSRDTKANKLISDGDAGLAGGPDARKYFQERGEFEEYIDNILPLYNK